MGQISANGPVEFINEFNELGFIGPSWTKWSNVVTVLRGGQDLGTVTQFKDDHDVVQYNR